jgi:translation initiation factor 2 alpha subunit (eIF-2alpha)
MLPKMFEGLGRSMADMADRACSRQQDAFGKAFDALTNVVKAQSDAFTSGMQQNRELQGELTALTRQLREEMLDAAEGEAEAIRESANGSSASSDMTALTELAVKVAGPAIVQQMMGGGEKKAS